MLSVKVTGAEQLQRSITSLGKAFTKANAEADLLVAVRPMVDAARENVRIGPPSVHLKDNVGAALVPDARFPVVAVGAFRTSPIGEIFYGSFLELGTPRMSARPWLRPAFDGTRDTVLGRLISLVRGRLLAAVGR